MKRLVGNPENIDGDYGDHSQGFDRIDDMEEYLSVIKAERLQAAEIPDYDSKWSIDNGLNRLIRQAYAQGFALDRVDAYYAWAEYSSSLSASWLNNADLELCRRYLVEEEMSEAMPI